DAGRTGRHTVIDSNINETTSRICRARGPFVARPRVAGPEMFADVSRVQQTSVQQSSYASVPGILLSASQADALPRSSCNVSSARGSQESRQLESREAGDADGDLCSLGAVTMRAKAAGAKRERRIQGEEQGTCTICRARRLAGGSERRNA